MVWGDRLVSCKAFCAFVLFSLLRVLFFFADDWPESHRSHWTLTSFLVSVGSVDKIFVNCLHLFFFRSSFSSYLSISLSFLYPFLRFN